MSSISGSTGVGSGEAQRVAPTSAAAHGEPDDGEIMLWLTLTMIPGLGPVNIGRLVSAMGSVSAVFSATDERVRTVEGMGPARVRALRQERGKAEQMARDELRQARDMGVRVVSIASRAYPPLLRQISDAPPVLYVRGMLDAGDETRNGPDSYPVAIVGSRACTAYGMEQAERFATHLSGAGLTVVSGGARGIDTAAHRAALRARGRTVAVLGCGLAKCYPEENQELFDRLAEHADDPTRSCGCVVSELPLNTNPSAENFPARNRIISGLSLGVLVIEAAMRSGALITARMAAEEHGREVFALPGRVDSPASEGSLALVRAGGASMVTSPADILEELESPARHTHGGTHAARYGGATLFEPSDQEPANNARAASARSESPAVATLSASQRALLEALSEPKTFDQLSAELARDAGGLRADVTMLELRRLVRRQGAAMVRVRE
jgi:DNA processing protein